MTYIRKAEPADNIFLAEIGKETFLDAHGHSAPPKDIDSYTELKYTNAVMKAELEDPYNLYHIIYFNEQPAGFSKIILSSPNPGIVKQNVTKLERIYILKEYYSRKIGSALMDFNIDLSKSRGEAGIWLHVWIENQRAYNFYLKKGFRVVSHYDFRISETHTNPNHVMYLEY